MTRSTALRDHNYFVSASPKAHLPSTVSATPSLALSCLQATSRSPQDASVGLQWPQLLPIIGVESKKLGKHGCAGGQPMSGPTPERPLISQSRNPGILEGIRAESPPHNNCIAQSSRQAGGVGTPTPAAVGMEKKREGKDNNKVGGYREAEGGKIRIQAEQHAEGGGGLRKSGSGLRKGGGYRSKQGIALAGAAGQINCMDNMREVAVAQAIK
ncbi:hypothetical protein B0H14DRAFT_2634246 [Mycena olivaceomarginata]|nr:hypothetical protein B0H14DRAFT_2634246 [Mycena olivaceomarginata]